MVVKVAAVLVLLLLEALVVAVALVHQLLVGLHLLLVKVTLVAHLLVLAQTIQAAGVGVLRQ
jgi:hypothetical protein